MSQPQHDFPCPYHPSAKEVADLIERAGVHPLGLDFLRHGAQEAVAATFGVHAFTVDAARRLLDDAAGRADS